MPTRDRQLQGTPALGLPDPKPAERPIDVLPSRSRHLRDAKPREKAIHTMSRITAGTPASSPRRQRGSTSAGGAIVRRFARWTFPPPIRHSATGFRSSSWSAHAARYTAPRSLTNAFATLGPACSLKSRKRRSTSSRASPSRRRSSNCGAWRSKRLRYCDRVFAETVGRLRR